MTAKTFSILLTKWRTGTIDPDEAKQFIQAFRSGQYDDLISESLEADLDANWFANYSTTSEMLEDWQLMLARKKLQITNQEAVKRVHFLKTAWFRYAAAIIILFGIGAYFFTSDKENTPALPAVMKPADIAPGKNGAVLTLADGTQVVLDSLGNGFVASQNGAEVLINNGQLIYNQAGNPSENVAYNTMRTTKGKQFQLMLPDGTRVWLNAASSISYPTVFSGSERSVEAKGEVYFEVAKNAAVPFKVKVDDDTEVKVLGTHFNINAYENEASVKTTLLEGSVQISAYDDVKTLKPGQQAVISTSKKLDIVENADIDQVMAWKNGFFNFENAGLQDIMKQLERWYDINVEYESGVPDLRFGGEISRNLSLADVLEVLERTKVHFRLEEGRKLIVTK